MSFCNFDGDESDDEDDFFIDSSDCNDYRTNSSSSSLVWSAEARKQNEEDWLQIERILYGEEELPEDEKTKEEFQEWMEAFPHLRIVGTKLTLPPRSNLSFEPNSVDEIIAIDPPLVSESFKNLDHELNEKLSLRKARQSASGIRQVRDEELENFLRVTSSGVTRNSHPAAVKKSTIDKTIFIKQNTNPGLLQSAKRLSKITENQRLDSSSFHRELEEKLIIHSATPSRPTTTIDLKFLYKKPNLILDDVKSIKSASTKLPIYADIARLEPMKVNKPLISSKSASIHHQRHININTIRLPPFNYDDINYPIIVRGYNQNNTKNLSKISKH